MTDMLNSGSGENLAKPVRKRGRPKKSGPKVEKPRPECEKLPQSYEHRKVVWGTEPQYAKYRRLGIAVLHKESAGQHLVLMPVTDDDSDIRWRYRWVPGPAPYHYEMMTIEPAAARELARLLIEAVDEWFGGQQGANKVEQTIVADIKEQKQSNRTDELLQKYKGIL